jgi:pescadillo
VLFSLSVTRQDVDFRIMLTFLEFYEVLLKFVMFKLYTQEDLRYTTEVYNCIFNT